MKNRYQLAGKSFLFGIPVVFYLSIMGCNQKTSEIKISESDFQGKAIKKLDINRNFQLIDSNEIPMSLIAFPHRGKTKAELGSSNYYKLIIKARGRLEKLKAKEKISFSLGINDPIRFGNSKSITSAYNIIGFVNAQDNSRFILVKDILAMYNREIDNFSRLYINNPKKEEVHVVTLVVQNIKDKKVYIAKNINYEAFVRDSLNASLNNKIYKLNSDINLLNVRQDIRLEI